jgi:8-oxo-dGTP diphosphatase
VGIIRVAVGVLTDAAGRVLLARSSSQAHQGGLWEFPGGKIEAGESVEQALTRELHEELGIGVIANEPLIAVSHDYGDRRVLLDVHRVITWTGLPKAREGQPLRWARLDRLDRWPLPAADRPIVAALTLPDGYLMADGVPVPPEHPLVWLKRVFDAGFRLVRLSSGRRVSRTDDLLRQRMLRLAQHYRARLLVDDPGSARSLPGLGVHLSGLRLMGLNRRPLDTAYLVAVSCRTLQELRQAVRIGANFVVWAEGPASITGPALEPSDWRRFQNLARESALPIYLHGNIGTAAISLARRHGAQGIAGCALP